MTNIQALILGVIQGLTEYLPVSSSAHLVLVPKLMGWNFLEEEAFVFNVLVQQGTLVGVLIYFCKPLLNIARSMLKFSYDDNARLGWLVGLASVPAAVFGFLFKDDFVSYFSSAKASSMFLVCTGFILLIAEKLSSHAHTNREKITYRDALIIGLAQGLALFPGISRSGSTIAAGMLGGLARRKAAFFSFIMSVPIMLGASMLVSIDLLNSAPLIASLAMPIVIGFLSAAVSGYLVIKWFMMFVARQPLYIFAAYCIGLGLFGTIYFW